MSSLPKEAVGIEFLPGNLKKVPMDFTANTVCISMIPN